MAFRSAWPQPPLDSTSPFRRIAIDTAEGPSFDRNGGTRRATTVATSADEFGVGFCASNDVAPSAANVNAEARIERAATTIIIISQRLERTRGLECTTRELRDYFGDSQSGTCGRRVHVH